MPSQAAEGASRPVALDGFLALVPGAGHIRGARAWNSSGSSTAALGDRYRFERELGRGGMAVVFLAEDLKHRRLVAIKVFKPELSAVLGGDPFLREIEIAATLQHPHILPLYDSGQAARPALTT